MATLKPFEKTVVMQKDPVNDSFTASGKKDPSVNGNGKSDASPDALRAALEMAGIKAPAKEVLPREFDKNIFRDTLTRFGAGMDDAAAALGMALNDEKTRLPAARLALEAHGALKKEEGAVSVPSVTINLIGQSDSQKNILQILAPRSQQNE